MFRMFYDNASVTTPSSLGLISMFTKSRIQNYVLNHKAIVSSTLVNDFRVTYLRDASQATDATAEGMERLEFVPGRGFGHFTPGVIASISTNSSGPQYWRQNLFEFMDDVAVSRGAHALKFGGIAKRLRYNSLNVGRLRGEYIFNSLTEVLTANAARFEAGHVTEGLRGMRQSLYGFYLQDDWRPTPRLALNFGVRYEFVTGVTEANGRVSQLRNQLDRTVTVGNPWFLNPSKKNFVPRVGFAYDLTGDGKTSVRGGFGVYPDQLLARLEPAHAALHAALLRAAAGNRDHSLPRRHRAISAGRISPERSQSIHGDDELPSSSAIHDAIQFHLAAPVERLVFHHGGLPGLAEPQQLAQRAVEYRAPHANHQRTEVLLRTRQRGSGGNRSGFGLLQRHGGGTAQPEFLEHPAARVRHQRQLQFAAAHHAPAHARRTGPGRHVPALPHHG
jgi:hypothetical protein